MGLDTRRARGWGPGGGEAAALCGAGSQRRTPRIWGQAAVHGGRCPRGAGGRPPLSVAIEAGRRSQGSQGRPSVPGPCPPGRRAERGSDAGGLGGALLGRLRVRCLRTPGAPPPPGPVRALGPAAPPAWPRGMVPGGAGACADWRDGRGGRRWRSRPG